MKSEEYKKRLQRKPEQIVEEAIVGMLPHTKLGRAMASKLKVYRDDKHPHTAQKPEALAAPPSAHKRAQAKLFAAKFFWKDQGSPAPDG